MKRLLLNRTAGILLSLLVALAVYAATAGSELSLQARATMSVTLFTVIWWAFGVIPPAYTAIFMILLFVVGGIAGPADVLGFWSGPMAWLMIGAYLIARGVTRAGLAQRIALRFLSRYASSYRRLVVMIYALNVVLAPLVPLPFPRAFLIMALVDEILAQSETSASTRTSLGFAVFMGSVPASMMFLTAESILNPVTASLAGGISWMEWAVLMTLPSLAAALLMLAAHLLVFPAAEIDVDTTHLARKLRDLGRPSPKEIRALLWVLAALVMWMTDSWHGVHPGWVAMAAAVGMALPSVGGILGNEDLTEGVDWSALIFATGALAIGTVATSTGLSAWVVDQIAAFGLPAATIPLMAYVAAAGFALHLFVGSVLATLSMLVPPLVALTARLQLPAFAPALLVYTVSVMGVALPFHNLMILVGVGDAGHFSERETLRFFPALTLITFLVVGIQIVWWSLLGRL